MSDKARKLIREAVKAHLVEDGASDLGAYRDVVTEVLHLAYHNNKLNGWERTDDFRMFLKDTLLNEAFLGFEEEVENDEMARIAKIPKTNLPLYINQVWETEAGLKMYQNRLKGN
jgi:hypothetical protein